MKGCVGKFDEVKMNNPTFVSAVHANIFYFLEPIQNEIYDIKPPRPEKPGPCYYL